jgi:3-oxoacyl-[acyl-carrier-protein] synthase III
MNGKTVFSHAVKKMPEAIYEALRANSLKIEDIDLFVFHQANLRINESESNRWLNLKLYPSNLPKPLR